MTTITAIARPIFTAAACLLATAASAAAKSPSVCPPMFDREVMLNSVSNIALGKRLAELCEIPKSTAEQKAAEAMDTQMPCLNELGVKAQDIKTATQSGIADAEDSYKKTEDKKLLCEKVREDY